MYSLKFRLEVKDEGKKKMNFSMLDDSQQQCYFVELTYFTTLQTFKASVSVSKVKNKGFAKEETC